MPIQTVRNEIFDRDSQIARSSAWAAEISEDFHGRCRGGHLLADCVEASLVDQPISDCERAAVDFAEYVRRTFVAIGWERRAERYVNR